MMAADYRHIGGRENRLGRHYSRFSPFWPTPALSGQSLALRKLCDAGSNRRSQIRAADLSGADLSHADLINAGLTNAFLTDARLNSANPIGAIVTQGQLDAACGTEAKLDPGLALNPCPSNWAPKGSQRPTSPPIPAKPR